MTSLFRIFGYGLGVVALGFWGYSFFKGEVNLAQSMLFSDMKTIYRAADPLTFYLVMLGAAVLIVLYWIVFLWLVRTVLPKVAAAQEKS